MAQVLGLDLIPTSPSTGFSTCSILGNFACCDKGLPPLEVRSSGGSQPCALPVPRRTKRSSARGKVGAATPYLPHVPWTRSLTAFPSLPVAPPATGRGDPPA